ncbi:MAG TPA: undecaprenyl-diphosphatase [Euryarchaeota archaeon]|nr:undecaprenyl-diphosphatase BcrC [archaeon BMS3Bbin15]HDL15804.1 undecaprenyl-diphosphatase [Euryarchaeota archaeon]
MISELNIAMFNYINHFAGTNPILDYAAIIAAKYMPIIFILWVVYLWFKNKYQNTALYCFYASILGLSFNFIIGSFYYHPRPFMLHLGKLLVLHSSDSSFPSDHTTFMLSIAFTLIYFRKTRTSGLILFVLGFLGGFARVFVGIHFPFDIIGSAVVAIFSSFIIYSLRTRLKPLNNLFISLYSSLIRR